MSPIRQFAPLPERPRDARSRVSIVMPCFNHGRFMEQALGAIAEQTYAAIETIVVDDGSTDEQTRALMERLGREPTVTVERLERNRGPAVARNTGVRRATGRYVLPADADNRLLPNAVADLVAQLEEAPPNVGFIYPNLQFFGNRHDYWVAPPYNLFALLHGNYCDTCSLVDRSVFDAGIFYPEGIFREDWHFVLTLAKHGIVGEPARTKTLMFRKRGFNRSDLVGHSKGGTELDEVSWRKHPELFGSYRSYARVKAQWCPALSIVALDEIGSDEVAHVRDRLERQTAVDAEVLMQAKEWTSSDEGPFVRRLAPALAHSPIERLRQSLHAARGAQVMVTGVADLELLDDRAFIEKLLRMFVANAQLGAVGFAEDGAEDHYPWQPLDAAAPPERAHSVAWSLSRIRGASGDVIVGPGGLIGGLVAGLSQVANTQWRHVPAPGSDPPLTTREHVTLKSGTAEGERWAPISRARAAPLLPGVRDSERRQRQSLFWLSPQCGRLAPTEEDQEGERQSVVWLPPQSQPLFRYVQLSSGRRVITTSARPPRTFTLEHRLGTVKKRALPGTRRLEASGAPGSLDVRFRAVAEEEPVEDGQRALGFVEVAALPMLVPLKLTIIKATGQLTLSTDSGDPLHAHTDVVAHLGFIEPSPLHPVSPVSGRQRVDVARSTPAAEPPSLRAGVDWMLAPLRWQAPMARRTRMKAAVGRAAQGVRFVVRRQRRRVAWRRACELGRPHRLPRGRSLR